MILKKVSRYNYGEQYAINLIKFTAVLYGNNFHVFIKILYIFVIELHTTRIYLHIFMKMHAADRGGVAIQCVYALTRVRVPHLQCAVSRPADDDVSGHLWWPYTTCMPYQSP